MPWPMDSSEDCVNGQFLDTPIGKGGKVDDTSVVVGETWSA